MTNTNPDAQSHTDWVGADVYDQTGDKIGSIDDIYLDDQSGQPEWLTVSTGWFGTSTQFVPIAGSSRHEDGLMVPYSTDHIKDAPSIDTDKHLDAPDERRLYEHYGMNFDATDHETTYGGQERADEGYEYAETRASTDDTGTTAGDGKVTLSEEELAVDKVEHEAGTVRLRKYVVEEDVNITVPVKKQVARIVRTAATGEAGTIDGDESVEEITLKEEEIVIDKNVVAKETVGIETETVTEERQVTDTVRKERVDVEGDVEGDT